MNKLLVILALIATVFYNAQSFARLNPVNTGWAPVDTYADTRINNLVALYVQVQGAQGLQMNQWSMTFRVNGPIYNGIKNFPAQRLKFQFNNLTYSGAGNGIAPTVSNTNLNTAPIPFQITDSYFVQLSPYDLGMKDYFSIIFNYDLMVEGGAYLQEYSSWNNFKVNLIMELRNRKGDLMTEAPLSFDLRIMPMGAPPSTPTYGIQIDANAKNVLLEFKTANDYANGVAKAQTKAFSTYSNTPYVVRVNTLTSTLASSTNKTLPVSAVKLVVRDNQSQAVTGTVNLSSIQQNVLTSAAHSGTRFFDTTYSTEAGDATFTNKSSEQYSGTLVFTMIPQ